MAADPQTERLFRDDSYSAQFLGNLKTLQGEFSDMTLESREGVQMQTSRMVLAAASNFFKTLFIKERGKKVIKLENLSGDMLKLVLSFCHTGELIINVNNVQDLLMCSDYCGLISLQDGCIDFIHDHLEISNSFDVLQLADSISSIKLITLVARFIATHYSQFGKDSLMNLSSQQLAPILASNLLAVRDKDTNLLPSPVDHELRLLDFVVEYIKRNNTDNIGTKRLITSLKLVLLLPTGHGDSVRALLPHDKEFQQFLSEIEGISDGDDHAVQMINILKKYPSDYNQDTDFHSVGVFRGLSNLTIEGYIFADGQQVNEVLDKYEKFYKCETVPVTGLVIWLRSWDGRLIVGGMEVHWSSGRYGRFGMTEGGDRHEFHLEAGEYIDDVKVRSGWLVDQLTFYTSRGREFGPYGGFGGREYSLSTLQPRTLKTVYNCKEYRALSGFSATTVDTQGSPAFTSLVLWFRGFRGEPKSIKDLLDPPATIINKSRQLYNGGGVRQLYNEGGVMPPHFGQAHGMHMFGQQLEFPLGHEPQ